MRNNLRIWTLGEKWLLRQLQVWSSWLATWRTVYFCGTKQKICGLPSGLKIRAPDFVLPLRLLAASPRAFARPGTERAARASWRSLDWFRFVICAYISGVYVSTCQGYVRVIVHITTCCNIGGTLTFYESYWESEKENQVTAIRSRAQALLLHLNDFMCACIYFHFIAFALPGQFEFHG